MKKLHIFCWSCVLFITPNIAYYLLTIFESLRKTSMDEHFVQRLLYIDYLPEALVLSGLYILCLCSVKTFIESKNFSKGYIIVPAVLLLNIGVNSVLRIVTGFPQYFGIGYATSSWYRGFMWFLLFASLWWGYKLNKEKF